MSSDTSPSASGGLPSSDGPSSAGGLSAWAQLVRLPNVFTILADVTAAFLLVAQGPAPVGRLALILAGGVSLYWAGMILNDVFDIEKDRRERSKRPLASGQIPLGQAKIAGWVLLGLGIVLAAASGFVPSSAVSGAGQLGTTWSPLAVATVLAVMIVAYDGPLKSTPFAPAAMGACRTLSFLLGASAALPMSLDDGGPFPDYVLAIALGFGVYVMGLTTMGRREATGGGESNLWIGLVVIIIGSALLAFAPQLAGLQPGWTLDTQGAFPLLIGMITFPVFMRGLRVIRDPVPANIQAAVRIAILTIIPLSASFAFLGAGPGWGLAVFFLVVPALVLAAKFRVT